MLPVPDALQSQIKTEWQEKDDQSPEQKNILLELMPWMPLEIASSKD